MLLASVEISGKDKVIFQGQIYLPLPKVGVPAGFVARSLGRALRLLNAVDEF